MGVSTNRGTPSSLDGIYFMENAKQKWMMTEGVPLFQYIWVSINGGYPNGSFIMENHIKMDDLDSQK